MLNDFESVNFRDIFALEIALDKDLLTRQVFTGEENVTLTFYKDSF